MNKLIKPVLLLFTTIFVQTLYPFSSYRLLKNGQSNYVLLLGEIHNSVANPTRTDVETFIQTFLKYELSKPIPCVVELGKEAQSLFMTGKQPEDITVGKTFVQLAEYAQTYKDALSSRLSFVLYDPRELESDIINSTSSMLSREIKTLKYNFLPFPNSLEWQADKNKIILTSHEPLSLYTYFSNLGDYHRKICFMRDRFALDSPFLPIFNAHITSLEKAIFQVLNLFTNIDPNMRLETALLTLFDRCVSLPAQEAWNRYTEVIKLLLDTVDYPYAQIMFLGKLLELLQNSRKVIMILSEDHAVKLSEFLQKGGYTLLREEVIFKEAEESLRNALSVGIDGWHTDLVKLATFSKHLAEELEIFLEKQFPCTVCQKKSEKKVCSQCRTTYYCSSQCQRSHWPQHKLTCKK